MQIEIEAIALDIGLDPKADQGIDRLQDDEGRDRVVDHHRQDADCLIDDLAAIALDQPGGAAILADGEDAGQKRARGAADRMHAEDAERVVIAEGGFEPDRTPVADDAGDRADDQSADRTDEARGGRGRQHAPPNPPRPTRPGPAPPRGPTPRTAPSRPASRPRPSRSRRTPVRSRP